MQGPPDPLFTQEADFPQQRLTASWGRRIPKVVNDWETPSFEEMVEADRFLPKKPLSAFAREAHEAGRIIA